MTDLQIAPSDVDLDGAEVHVLCCRDHSVTLCSVEVSGPTCSDDEPVTCVVCVDLELTDFCPRGYICSVVDKRNA